MCKTHQKHIGVYWTYIVRNLIKSLHLFFSASAFACDIRNGSHSISMTSTSMGSIVDQQPKSKKKRNRNEYKVHLRAESRETQYNTVHAAAMYIRYTMVGWWFQTENQSHVSHIMHENEVWRATYEDKVTSNVHILIFQLDTTHFTYS